MKGADDGARLSITSAIRPGSHAGSWPLRDLMFLSFALVRVPTAGESPSSSPLQIVGHGLPADALQPAMLGLRDRPLCEVADFERQEAIVIPAGVPDGQQCAIRIAAAQKLTRPVIPRLTGCQDQLAVEVGVESIEMKTLAASFLDMRPEHQGQGAATWSSSRKW